MNDVEMVGGIITNYYLSNSHSEDFLNRLAYVLRAVEATGYNINLYEIQPSFLSSPFTWSRSSSTYDTKLSVFERA